MKTTTVGIMSKRVKTNTVSIMSKRVKSFKGVNLKNIMLLSYSLTVTN